MPCKKHLKHLIERKIKWKSVNEAPIKRIQKIMKDTTGKELSEDELNDIILEGEF